MQHIYYLENEKQVDGCHLVHTARCEQASASTQKYFLGVYASCVDAVQDARKIRPNSKGCVYCCRL